MQNLKKNGLLLQKWQKFGEFWSKHSKICTLIGSFSAIHTTFNLKKYRWVTFHGTGEPCKIWRKTDLWFGKWYDQFGKFSTEHFGMSKLGLQWDPFIQSRKCIRKKYTEKLCVITLKNDEKF